MKAIVFLLRRDGRRFHDRNQEGVAGELTLHTAMRGNEMFRIAQLHIRHDGSARTHEALPPLYNPELVALGPRALLLRGFEAAGGVGFVQEWRCELL